VLLSPIRAIRLPHPILLELIITLGEECWLCSSSLSNFLHLSVIPSLFGPNIIFSSLMPNTLSPLMPDTKFHTHIEQQAEL
jgi:hypothetical protein